METAGRTGGGSSGPGRSSPSSPPSPPPTTRAPSPPTRTSLTRHFPSTRHTSQLSIGRQGCVQIDVNVTDKCKCPITTTSVTDIHNACLVRDTMGDYYTPDRGTMEIMCPEGHIMSPGLWQPSGGIMQPEGGIMFPEGCIISIGPRAGVL